MIAISTPYKKCPRCGAHIDAGESCDCAARPAHACYKAKNGQAKRRKATRYRPKNSNSKAEPFSLNVISRIAEAVQQADKKKTADA